MHDTPEAMLDAGGLDGVLIATPTALHLPMVQLVAASGLPILCEKPCGLTARGAAEAARITDALGVRLQVAYWRRFVPRCNAFASVSPTVRWGTLSARLLSVGRRAAGRGFRVGSGGIFIDMGVHEFDQIRWLSGQDIADAHAAAAAAVGEAAVPGDSESAQALCRLSGGATAIVSLGRRFPLGDICRVEAFGTKHAEEARFLWPPDADAAFLGALRRQAEGFASWESGGPPVGASAADAVAALAAAEAASETTKLVGQHQHR